MKHSKTWPILLLIALLTEALLPLVAHGQGFAQTYLEDQGYTVYETGLTETEGTMIAYAVMDMASADLYDEVTATQLGHSFYALRQGFPQGELLFADLVYTSRYEIVFVAQAENWDAFVAGEMSGERFMQLLEWGVWDNVAGEYLSPLDARDFIDKDFGAGSIRVPLQPKPESGLPAAGWTASYGGPDNARANPGAHLRLPLALAWEWGGGENNPMAVAVAGEKVFLLTSRGKLCFLEASTGAERTCQALWPDERSPASTAGLVALTGDTVVVGATETYIKSGEHVSSTRSRLATFSRDGQPRWALPPAENVSAYALVADQGLVVAAPQVRYGVEPSLAAFDAAGGAQRWRLSGAFPPGASDGLNLYTGGVSAFRLTTGDRLWEQKLDAQSLAYAGGRLYAATEDALVCQDAKTGRVVWQTSFALFPAYAAVAHGHVYLIPEPGATYHGYRPGVMALDAATGQEQWSALTEGNLSAHHLAASADEVVVVGADYETFVDQLWVLDATKGAVLDRVPLGRAAGGPVAVAGEQLYVLGPTLRVYGPGKPGAPTPRPTATTKPTPKPTPTPPFPVTGRYATVWQRLGGAGGRLGQPLGPAVEEFVAEQHFERGLMHWGRWDTVGEPEREVHAIVYGQGGSNHQSGNLWGRFIDYWREGDDEYSCPQAKPPLGPRRGFGLVWCQYVRDSLGAPLEEEYGLQAGYQDFQYGTMLWSPTDKGIYVLFNQGDWRFEKTE